MRQIYVSLPDEMSQALKNFAEAENITEAEALRRAIALLALALREKQSGAFLAFAKSDADNQLQPIARVEGV